MTDAARHPEDGAPPGYFDDYEDDCAGCGMTLWASELWTIGDQMLCDDCMKEIEDEEEG